MAWTLLYAYGVIGLASAVIVFALSVRMNAGLRPVPHRMLLSLASGAMWPLLLIGAAEFGSFAAYAKVHEHDDDAVLT